MCMATHFVPTEAAKSVHTKHNPTQHVTNDISWIVHAPFFQSVCVKGCSFPPVLIPLLPLLKKEEKGDDQKLIVAVQSRTFIYDQSDWNHHNKDLIMAAWENIGEETGRRYISTYQYKLWTADRWLSMSVCLSLVECVCVCAYCMFRVYAREFTSFCLTSIAVSDRVLYERFCRDGRTENVRGRASMFSMNAT